MYAIYTRYDKSAVSLCNGTWHERCGHQFTTHLWIGRILGIKKEGKANNNKQSVRDQLKPTHSLTLCLAYDANFDAIYFMQYKVNILYVNCVNTISY